MQSTVVPLRPESAEAAPVPFHELANVLPLLEGERFEELKASIKETGQIDPITLFERAILDGRNRYRACAALGVPPRFEELGAGIDPVKFVVGRNISRRDLTLSQRSFAMARFASYGRGGSTETRKLSNGNEVPIAQPDAQPAYTQEEAAKIAGSNTKYIQYGKIILDEGTVEEKQAVQNGSDNIGRVAKKIIARRPEQTAAPAPVPPAGQPIVQRSSNGPRIKTPDDMSVSEWCRRGMAWEAEGRSGEEVAKKLGWDRRVYSNARDVCLLFDRRDLTGKDRRLVAEAYAEMNQERRAAASYAKVRHLGEMIWGKGKERGRAEKQRHDAFINALVVIEATCARAADLEVPYMGGDAIREAQTQVDEAIKHLRQLRSKLNRKEVA